MAAKHDWQIKKLALEGNISQLGSKCPGVLEDKYSGDL
jgi:hypothetical protein